MMTTSITAPTSKFSYFQFTTTGDVDSGYSHTSKDNGTMYVGQSTKSNTDCGANCGVFGIVLYDLPDRDKIGAIKSITFTTKTSDVSGGYNDCVARVEYVGTTYNSTTPLWRVGSTDDQWSLEEGKTTSLMTTDSTTCSHFKALLSDATSEMYYYFRIIRESGMGAVLKTAITLTIEYEEGAQSWIYNGSTWVTATPYIYDGQAWVQATAKLFADNEWN